MEGLKMDFPQADDANLAQRWEQTARSYARRRRDLASRIFAALEELEKMPDTRAMKVIRILKGTNYD